MYTKSCPYDLSFHHILIESPLREKIEIADYKENSNNPNFQENMTKRDSLTLLEQFQFWKYTLKVMFFPEQNVLRPCKLQLISLKRCTGRVVILRYTFSTKRKY